MKPLQLFATLSYPSTYLQKPMATIMSTYNKNDPATIKALFNSIARQYDRTNAVLSFQMHKKWNKALVDRVLVRSQPRALLDLCCGTGAIAYAYLEKIQNPTQAYLLDFSEGMLSYAQDQANLRPLQAHHINFLQADAQAIPLANASVDCATIAYGIRNVHQPRLCIQDVFRVLRPGGTFGILELTEPENPLMKLGHKIYLRMILPVIGKLLTSNKEAYQYLCNSIHTFIPPQELENLLRSTGFGDIERHSLSGGIATLLIGKKPNS